MFDLNTTKNLNVDLKKPNFRQKKTTPTLKLVA